MSKIPTIIIVDDDPTIRLVIARTLTQLGFLIEETDDIDHLWQLINNNIGDLIIIDVVMPGHKGLDILSQIKAIKPHLPVLVISALSTLTTAMEANERGAYDYLAKPFRLEDLTGRVTSALASMDNSATMINSDDPSNDYANSDSDRIILIGRSPVMQDIYRSLSRVAKTDLTALITGESGTGKELIAKALHFYSRRRNAPFIAINMAAIPRDLIESELFGHEKGAFTNAHTRYAGRFQQANGGTLFLDEIGDMPITAQTRLLRVLQDGEYTPVGSNSLIKMNTRIVTATNHNLLELIRKGSFREDLYYRLNVVPLHLPALRERGDDIPELVHYFLQKNNNGQTKKFNEQAMILLQNHSWPGNVRELQNLIQRLIVLCPSNVINADRVNSELRLTPAPTDNIKVQNSLAITIKNHLTLYFSAHSNELPPNGLYDRIIHEVERPLIEMTLSLTNNNQLKTAELLGINRNTLRKKITYLNIKTQKTKTQKSYNADD